jgi:hypothetical protein
MDKMNATKRTLFLLLVSLIAMLAAGVLLAGCYQTTATTLGTTPVTQTTFSVADIVAPAVPGTTPIALTPGTSEMATPPIVTNTQFPIYEVPLPTPEFTSFPRSAFQVTVTIQISPEVVRVGDNLTVTLTVTNTGKLEADQTHCGLYLYVGGMGTAEPKENPVLTFLSEEYWAIRLPPGDVQSCIFVFRAERPETIFLQGGYSGKVTYGMYDEYYGGNSSTWRDVRIHPAAP